MLHRMARAAFLSGLREMFGCPKVCSVLMRYSRISLDLSLMRYSRITLPLPRSLSLILHSPDAVLKNHPSSPSISLRVYWPFVRRLLSTCVVRSLLRSRITITITIAIAVTINYYHLLLLLLLQLLPIVHITIMFRACCRHLTRVRVAVVSSNWLFIIPIPITINMMIMIMILILMIHIHNNSTNSNNHSKQTMINDRVRELNGRPPPVAYYWSLVVLLMIVTISAIIMFVIYHY